LLPMGDVDNSRNLRGCAAMTAPVETDDPNRTLTQAVIQALRRNGARGWLVMPPEPTDGCDK
jgi:hypothetical protein